MADPRSMTGSKYEASRTDPSGFTSGTSKLSSLIYDNPNLRPAIRQANRAGQGVTPGYLAEGLSVDYEGLATAYALKYGQKATEKLMSALPYMNQSDLFSVIQDIGKAGNEYDDMRNREYKTYERNGSTGLLDKWRKE